MTEHSEIAAFAPAGDSVEIAGAVDELFDGVVRADLHALLRIEPFYNRRAHDWDSGWSCRDHAVLIAALLRVAGLTGIGVAHGLSMYVQGPTSTGLNPVGLGGGSHSWVRLQGYGDIDISPRVDEKPATGKHDFWREMPCRGGVCGRVWEQGGRTTSVVYATNASHYDNEINKATHATDIDTAVYFQQRLDPFAPAMLDCDYVKSPLTDQLHPILGASAYRIIGAHLMGLSCGARRPLHKISQRKAWRILSSIEPALVEEFTAALDVG